MKFKYYYLLFGIVLIGFSSNAQTEKTKVNITNPGQDIEIIGELGVPMGQMVTVTGIIVQGPRKGSEYGYNLVVQKIDTTSVQKFIRIPLTPYFHTDDQINITNASKVKFGKTYRLRAYETGEFAGRPLGAIREINFLAQTVNYYFRNELVVLSAVEIDAFDYHPSDFLGREGLFIGKAKNKKGRSYIVGKNWSIELPNDFKWSAADNNKKAEILGLVSATENEGVFKVSQGEPKLSKLKDQLGRTVTLHGTAWSMNGHWWFNYRGIDLYIEDMENLPNWYDYDNHGKAIEITGQLFKENLPRIDQISIKHIRDLEMQFIVKDATWKPLDGLLVPEEIDEWLRYSY